MKIFSLKYFLYILIILAVLSNALSKRKNKSKMNKKSRTLSQLKRLASMIDPNIVNENKYQKNLTNKKLEPEKNTNDAILLTQSLISRVLEFLGVPNENIEAKMKSVKPEELTAMMKIIIDFHKSTSQVDILKQLGKFNITGLDVNNIFPGIGQTITRYLEQHIIIGGRR